MFRFNLSLYSASNYHFIPLFVVIIVIIVQEVGVICRDFELLSLSIPDLLRLVFQMDEIVNMKNGMGVDVYIRV